MKRYEIIINGSEFTHGLVTIQIEADGDNYVLSGMLKTHKYIEEIDSIECDKFLIKGVEVYSETFGSIEELILYRFTYKDIDIKNYGNLSEEELKAIYDEEISN